MYNNILYQLSIYTLSMTRSSPNIFTSLKVNIQRSVVKPMREQHQGSETVFLTLKSSVDSMPKYGKNLARSVLVRLSAFSLLTPILL
jgi:hypothetical protein